MNKKKKRAPRKTARERALEKRIELLESQIAEMRAAPPECPPEPAKAGDLIIRRGGSAVMTPEASQLADDAKRAMPRGSTRYTREIAPAYSK